MAERKVHAPQPEPEADADPFAGYEPFPGLEHLGRAITDAQGQPSGSPANYEALRGRGDPAQAAVSAPVSAADVLTSLNLPQGDRDDDSEY